MQRLIRSVSAATAIPCRSRRVSVAASLASSSTPGVSVVRSYESALTSADRTCWHPASASSCRAFTTPASAAVSTSPASPTTNSTSGSGSGNDDNTHPNTVFNSGGEGSATVRPQAGGGVDRPPTHRYRRNHSHRRPNPRAAGNPNHRNRNHRSHRNHNYRHGSLDRHLDPRHSRPRFGRHDDAEDDELDSRPPTHRSPRSRRSKSQNKSHRSNSDSTKEGEDAKEVQRERPLATSSWICLTNIPPLSLLEDVAEEVGRVMQYELERGIVDLDEAERLMKEMERKEAGDAGETKDNEGEGETDKGEDGNTGEDYSGIDEHGVSHSGGSGAESVVGQVEEALPLWDPSSLQDSDDDDRVGSDSTHSSPASLSPIIRSSYIQEARLLLSVLGRPAGWYLRLPNRSCVHALLSHVEEIAAERDRLERADRERRRQGRKSSEEEVLEQRLARMPLSCGGREWNIGEFAPLELDTEGGEGGQGGKGRRSNINDKRKDGKIIYGDYNQSNTQHIESSFRRAADLRLDDSVLRVENCPSGTYEEDILYLFRRYDIIDTRRLRDDPALRPVQLLVRGETRRDRQRRERTGREPTYGPGEVAPVTGTVPITTYTFLVRMETAAEARAALSEMQCVEFKERELKLAQYPRQLLPSN